MLSPVLGFSPRRSLGEEQRVQSVVPQPEFGAKFLVDTKDNKTAEALARRLHAWSSPHGDQWLPDGQARWRAPIDDDVFPMHLRYPKDPQVTQQLLVTGPDDSKRLKAMEYAIGRLVSKSAVFTRDLGIEANSILAPLAQLFLKSTGIEIIKLTEAERQEAGSPVRRAEALLEKMLPALQEEGSPLVRAIEGENDDQGATVKDWAIYQGPVGEFAREQLTPEKVEFILNKKYTARNMIGAFRGHAGKSFTVRPEDQGRLDQLAVLAHRMLRAKLAIMERDRDGTLDTRPPLDDVKDILAKYQIPPQFEPFYSREGEEAAWNHRARLRAPLFYYWVAHEEWGSVYHAASRLRDYMERTLAEDVVELPDD